MSASDISALLAQLQTLPPDVNPYELVRTQLLQQIVRPQPRWFLVNVRTCAGLYAVILVFSLAAILGKIALGGLWLFRTRSTAMGRVWIPNATLLFSACMVLFCLMQEGSIWIRLELYHDSRLLVIWHRLLGPTWCNIALAIWAELWSQAASAYLAMPGHSASWLAHIPAWLFNFVFAIFPAALLATFLTAFGLMSAGFQHAYDAYARLDAGFAEASALWQVGDRIHFDPAWLGMFQEMGDAFNDYVQYALPSFHAGVSFLAIILCAAIVLAIVHIQLLRKQMVSADRMRRSSTSRSTLDRQFRLLQRTYGSLIAETICVCLVAATYTTLCALSAAEFVAPAPSGNRAFMIQVVGFYAYGIIDLVVNSLIAYRVVRPLIVSRWRHWQERHGAKRTEGEQMSGVTVVKTIERHIDHENVAELVALLKASASKRETSRYNITVLDSPEIPLSARTRTRSLSASPEIDMDDKELASPDDQRDLENSPRRSQLLYR